MRQTPQEPKIMKSTLTKPARWYVVTKYVQKRGISVFGSNAGETHEYLIAKEKFDVTDQINAIIKAAAPKRPRRAKKP
jgi:hypothetical protein